MIFAGCFLFSYHIFPFIPNRPFLFTISGNMLKLVEMCLNFSINWNQISIFWKCQFFFTTWHNFLVQEIESNEMDSVMPA